MANDVELGYIILSFGDRSHYNKTTITASCLCAALAARMCPAFRRELLWRPARVPSDGTRIVSQPETIPNYVAEESKRGESR